jgi:3-oxoacyl-[acyl-carrier-protein] synthase II
VVTGLGVVSCVGTSVETFWDALIAGRSGIATISSFDASGLAVRIAGEVHDFSFDPKLAKRMGRFTQFGVHAAREALTQAGLLEGDAVRGVDPARIGACIGSGIGDIPFLNAQYDRFLAKGPGRFHPLTVPITIPNMAAANVAIQFGLEGPNVAPATACATGNHGLAWAFDIIRAGRADVVVAGGSESTMNAFVLDGYRMLRALSTRNDLPEAASRPFSASRDGFVLAEGAGVLVLESRSHARARDAEVLAEMVGVGMTCDAHHLTAPEPEGRGAVRAMRLALEDGGVASDEVGWINAHGTSTPLNDVLETRAIETVFGAAAARIPVSSVKSMVGHCLGGAAAIEAVASVLALSRGVIPPTINLDDPDPELTLDYVPHEAREWEPTVVLSNAFAFGGHNATVVFSAG